ncbi:MAG: hypothetical protein K0Q94_3779 [Paenibacillus sp.]|jgi:multiple sugar transport system substrate-binding protein|uniref:ABC transporter substrate-binding protein n=1 Tax=Paenibacillus sp. GCM10012303 TaxID=3317340 RepID=UPI0029EF1116|nr:hypothetical protein [Paenibacillus sp.]
MMKKSRVIRPRTVLVPAILALILSACSSGGGTPAAGEKDGKAAPSVTDDQKAAELTFYLNSMTKKEFDEIYAPIIKAKYPNYVLKTAEPAVKGQEIQNLVAAGSVPDIVIGTKGTISFVMEEYGLSEDISELIKTRKYDLTRIEPVFIDAMKGYAGGKVIGLPVNAPANALHYNKTLFDKFGVAYPKDGMTWDDVYEIAKKMTRFEDGVQYRGYSERWHQIFMEFNQYSLPYLDPKEDKAAVNTDQWKKIVDGIVRFYKLPGLKFDSKTGYTEEDLKVFETGVSAMTVFARPDNYKTFEWDIVSVPTYKDKPNIGLAGSARYFFITNTSKEKEAAFNVMSHLTSDEVLLKLSKVGIAPPLAQMPEEMKKAFNQDNPLYQGKHVTSFFYNKPAPEPPIRAAGLTPFTKSQSILIGEVMKMIVEGSEVDANTALRTAEELINKGISEAKAAKK